MDGDAKDMKNHCAANPPISDLGASASWNGWGNDVANTRFQSAKTAGISADAVPRLKVKWAFGFPHATAAHAQPAVVAGRVFVGSNAGWVYSLDANTGCLYWSYKLKAMTRDAFSFGPVKGHPGRQRMAYSSAICADSLYGLDAQTGKELWVTRADDHFTSRVTGAPTLYEGKLFVPIASWGRIQREAAGVSMLHVARERCGAGREHRQTAMEVLHDVRSAETDWEEFDGHTVVWAVGRFGVERADDRREATRGAVRNGRGCGGSGSQDERCDCGRGHQQAASCCGHIKRNRTMCIWQ